MNRYRAWLEQAQRDLEKARIDLQYQYWEWACFTAQQAAEKAVKALLLYQGKDAWGHAITPMLRSLDAPTTGADLIEKAQLLDAFYIQTRYPNGFPEGKPADYFNASKAEGAIYAAEIIIEFCQDHISGPGPAAG
jgi:HEPN domain-containing protein